MTHCLKELTLLISHPCAKPDPSGNPECSYASTKVVKGGKLTALEFEV